MQTRSSGKLTFAHLVTIFYGRSVFPALSVGLGIWISMTQAALKAFIVCFSYHPKVSLRFHNHGF